MSEEPIAREAATPVFSATYFRHGVEDPPTSVNPSPAIRQFSASGASDGIERRAMKLKHSKSLQDSPAPSPTWAEVARASSRQVSADTTQVGADVKQASTTATQAASTDTATTPSFPGGDVLQAGDFVDHPKFGRCTVHRIVGDFVHMARENGPVIKLSQNIVSFTPAFIEEGKRVFSTSTQQ